MLSQQSSMTAVYNQASTPVWTILLYYQYVQIELPEKFAYDHLKLCKKLGLKGRILVADEGINGTIGGPKEATDEYMRLMREDFRFAQMEFKISEGPIGSFKKMFVRYRPELVTLAIKDQTDPAAKIDPNIDGGTYLEPEELKKMYDQNEDFVIIDMRNGYEAKIGKFKNAIILPMRVFKELPKIVDEQLKPYQNRKVVTYCTGGIRCEKASALLKKRGFKDVYQLHGGVAKYGQKFPDDYWEGKLFVFDERMAVPINSPDRTKIIASCLHCGQPEDNYINCTNAECNKLILLCPDCRTEWKDGCSEGCKARPRKLRSVV